MAIMGESGIRKSNPSKYSGISGPGLRLEGRYFLTEKALSILTEKEISASGEIIWDLYSRVLTFWIRSASETILSSTGAGRGGLPREMEQKIRPVAEALRITEILEKYPYGVSGGQKQGAAVARALITDPRIILADKTYRGGPGFQSSSFSFCPCLGDQ